MKNIMSYMGSGRFMYWDTIVMYYYYMTYPCNT